MNFYVHYGLPPRWFTMWCCQSPRANPGVHLNPGVLLLKLSALYGRSRTLGGQTAVCGSRAINILDTHVFIALLWGSRGQSPRKLWQFEVNSGSNLGNVQCNRQFMSTWTIIMIIGGAETYSAPPTSPHLRGVYKVYTSYTSLFALGLALCVSVIHHSHGLTIWCTDMNLGADDQGHRSRSHSQKHSFQGSLIWVTPKLINSWPMGWQTQYDVTWHHVTSWRHVTW